MNQSQMKYARERINAIASAKDREIRDKFYSKVTTLSFDQRVNALREGNFTVKTKTNKSYMPSQLEDYLVFNEENSIDYKELDKSLDNLAETKREMLDELMLGDSEKAMEALNTFKEYKV